MSSRPCAGIPRKVTRKGSYEILLFAFQVIAEPRINVRGRLGPRKHSIFIFCLYLSRDD